MDTRNKWEKRWHPLRQEWVVYSAHRNSRPWQGADKIKPAASPDYDPKCYLCPGNPRIHGHQNPDYKGVFIFDNDHPVVGMDAPDVIQPQGYPLYKKEKAAGVARVVCYDPRHNVSLSQMKLAQVQGVFKAFREEMKSLAQNPLIKSVLIFENKGEAVGVSNPHPHCQIYATDFDFKFVEQQTMISREHQSLQGKNIFEEIIANEQNDKLRILAENENAIGFIPFFARYAYEVMIFVKNPHSTLITLSDREIGDLAAVFHTIVRKLDMNYSMNFPYVMSIMQSPIRMKNDPTFRMHLWLQPPFRQPGLIKYLAGPEIGAGNFMADTTPEEKAAELRSIDVNEYQEERDA